MSVPLHYAVDGPDDAPVLVLGPALGTTGEVWAPQVAELARSFQVVRYDHRGHGGSPAPPGPYTLADLGEDVLALLDSLGGTSEQPVYLGGISLGGMVAGWVAAAAPEQVDRLVLVATSPRFGTPQMWQERATTVRTEGVAALADAALGRWLPAGYADAHPGVVAWVRRLLESTPAEGYAACCAALAQGDLTGVLSSITAPTLVIAGADDPASPPEHAYALAAAIPDARVEVVPEAAHLVGVAQPETVTRLLREFLGESDGRQ